MKRIIIFLFIVISIFTFGFEITPEYFGQRFDGEGGFQEYTLKNNSEKTLRYRFTALPSKNKEKSMHQWVILQPKFMTIKPGESRKLKIFARAPQGTKEGDYAFYLYVESINIPDLDKKEVDKTTIEAGTQVGINVAIQMLGWVGDLPADVRLENYSIINENEKNYIIGEVKNYTKKRFVRYRVTLYGNGNYEVVYGGVLIPNEKIKFKTPLSENFKTKNKIEKITIEEIPGNKVISEINL